MSLLRSLRRRPNCPKTREEGLRSKAKKLTPAFPGFTENNL